MRRIMFYGDSNTYGYDPADMEERRYPKAERWTTLLQERLGASWEVMPAGMNGRKLPNLKYDRERIEGLLGMLTADDIFAVMLGTNDILMTIGPDAREPVLKMQAFLEYLTGRRDPSGILVIAPPWCGTQAVKSPVMAAYRRECAKMNGGFRELSERFGVLFADAEDWQIGLSPDLVHFSAEGHAQFARKMGEYLLAL